jgi:hypothetical protein
MIKTIKRAYPSGPVPADFKNWLLKIKNIHLDEAQISSPIIEYVEAYPFQKKITYKKRLQTLIDVNGNKLKTIKLIRLT